MLSGLGVRTTFAHPQVVPKRELLLQFDADTLTRTSSPFSFPTHTKRQRAMDTALDLKRMKAPQLKALLKKRGLHIGGAKAELIERRKLRT